MWLAKFLNNTIKIAVFLNASFVYSQFQFNYNDNINVKYLGVNLNMPWAGGLNFSQFSEIDFDLAILKVALNSQYFGSRSSYLL